MREPRLVEQFEDLDKQAHAARLGMWMFLASEVMLFAVLFALYAGYRTMYGVDFADAAAHNDVLIGTVNTYVLITSSFTVALAVHAVRSGHVRRAGMLLVVTILFGLGFLVLKGVEYVKHFHHGIVPGVEYDVGELNTAGARTFFTLYFLMTGLHALHVAAGAIALGVLAVGCFRSMYSPARQIPVELGSLYWHMVDVVWIFLWPLLYLADS